MNIRQLIEKALNEARDEFAAIVQRKLEELMGDAEAPTKPARAAGRPRASTPVRSGAKAAEAARRSRAPESHMAELRAKVLAAMPQGEPLKRSQIVERARLGGGDETRVATVLRKLKDEGILVMRGTKASATYTRKG